MTTPQVSTHSIRCRILKGIQELAIQSDATGFNPFDPMQDTERSSADNLTIDVVLFQPIRSDAGY